MSESGFATGLAEWLTALRWEDLPRRVIEEAKNQVLSVIASVHAGHFSDAGRSVTRSLREMDTGRDATLIPSGERVSIHDAVLGNTALSASLGYDDYLFGGHTGHASVLATLAAAEKIGVGGRRVLLAQIVGNEIGGRMGACLHRLAPSPEMLPSIHAVAAAASMAKLLELDAAHTESALAIALMQRPGPAVPALFFGSEARLLTTALAVPNGIRAAELAAAGVRVPPGTLSADDGLLSDLGVAPAPGAFTALGSLWLTETLSYKALPGHAAHSAALECTLHVARQNHVDAKAVARVRIDATEAAVDIEQRSRAHLNGPDSLAAPLCFSLSYGVAAALFDRELTARQLTRDRIGDRGIWELASCVEVRADAEMEQRFWDRSLFQSRMSGGERSIDLQLDKANLLQFADYRGARVRVEMRDGRSFSADQQMPSGGAGRPFEERRRTVEDKFRRETRYTLRKERMERAIDHVHHLHEANPAQVRDLVRASCSEKV